MGAIQRASKQPVCVHGRQVNEWRHLGYSLLPTDFMNNNSPLFLSGANSFAATPVRHTVWPAIEQTRQNSAIGSSQMQDICELVLHFFSIFPFPKGLPIGRRIALLEMAPNVACSQCSQWSPFRARWPFCALWPPARRPATWARDKTHQAAFHAPLVSPIRASPTLGLVRASSKRAGRHWLSGDKWPAGAKIGRQTAACRARGSANAAPMWCHWLAGGAGLSIMVRGRSASLSGEMGGRWASSSPKWSGRSAGSK